jgi:hypothetical protein
VIIRSGASAEYVVVSRSASPFLYGMFCAPRSVLMAVVIVRIARGWLVVQDRGWLGDHGGREMRPDAKPPGDRRWHRSPIRVGTSLLLIGVVALLAALPVS